MHAPIFGRGRVKLAQMIKTWDSCDTLFSAKAMKFLGMAWSMSEYVRLLFPFARSHLRLSLVDLAPTIGHTSGRLHGAQ